MPEPVVTESEAVGDGKLLGIGFPGVADFGWRGFRKVGLGAVPGNACAMAACRFFSRGNIATSGTTSAPSTKTGWTGSARLFRFA